MDYGIERANMETDNLEIIRQKLMKPNSYLVLPTDMADTPLPHPDFKKGDFDDEYYSANELASLMGSLLVLVYRLDNQFFMMRYGVAWDEMQAFSDMLESQGMVNIAKRPDGSLIPAKDLDYSKFNGDEYLILPIHQANDVPVSIPKDEDA